MNLSIAAKLNIMISILMVALGLSTGWFVAEHESTAIKEEMRARGQAIAQHLAVYCEFGILADDREGLSKILDGVIKQKDIISASVSDKKGQLIARSLAGQHDPVWEFTVPVITHGQLGGIEEFELLSQIQDEQSSSETLIGYVKLGMSPTELDLKVAQVKKIILSVVVLLMVSAMIFAFLGVKYFINHPLRQLISGINEIGSGDLSSRIRIKNRDEIGKVGDAFNAMAETLSTTVISKSFLDNIIQSMMETLIVLDNEGKIKLVNPAVSLLLGYTKEELVGRPIFTILESTSLHPEQANPLKELLAENVEKIYLKKSGGRVPVIFSGALITKSAKGPPDMVCVARDLTEQKQAQHDLAVYNKKLELSNRELDKFAYVVSHDLKAPLRAIANLSQWIEEDLGNSIPDNIRSHLAMLRGRVQRMESLILGILEYARVGRIGAKKEPVDVQELIADIIDSMPVPEGFLIEISPGMPTLVTSRTQMTQVFANLIDNAVKYCKREDGRVAITAHDQGDFFEFAVIDNGPGIAPQYHEKIFEIFQTLVPRDEFESTGVGLTVVKKILTEQNCGIKVESDGSQGAAFRFTWPKFYTKEIG
ncbi:MAG: PAS domain S-box protein [Deltaproteobacteria bacterium]|nr:PAS domain S-box protein [Deltaproteobacteria bacterium]